MPSFLSLLKCRLVPASGVGRLPARKWVALAYTLIQSAGWLYCAYCLDKAVGFDLFGSDPVNVVAAKAFPGAGHVVVAMQTLAMVE